MEAGFKAGDQVVAVNGAPVWRWDDMRTIIAKSAGQKLTVTVEREGGRTDLTVTPKLSDQKDMLGEEVGQIGVAPSGKTVKLAFAAALSEGVRFTLAFDRAGRSDPCEAR